MKEGSYAQNSSKCMAFSLGPDSVAMKALPSSSLPSAIPREARNER